MSWWGWAKELRILIGSDLTQTWKLSSWVWRNWRCGYGFVPWPPNSQCLPFSSWGQAYRRWFDTHITQEICGRYLGQNAQHRCCSWFLTTLNSLPTSLSFTMELPIDNKIFFYPFFILRTSLPAMVWYPYYTRDMWTIPWPECPAPMLQLISHYS